MAGRPRSPARRRLILAGLSAAAMAAVSARGRGQTSGGQIGGPEAGRTRGPQPGGSQAGFAVVSRERILHEAVAARRLREAEEAMTARLQGQIDDTKAAFAAEEEELAHLRGNLPDDQFDTRVADFDRRVRLARRNAQERAAVLQKAFQDARAAIVAALPALMERLRVETGASVVLDGDQVLALDPAADLTDRAIALFDAEGPSPEPPQIDFSSPLSPPPGGASPTAPGDGPGAPSGDMPPEDTPPAR